MNGGADGALEGNMKKYLLIIFIFSLLLIGCSKNTEQLYEKMMSISKDSKQKIYLSFFEVNGSSGNKYYDKIISLKEINIDYLYKQAMTCEKTNFVFELMNYELATGDIALSILWDKYQFDNEDINKLFPENIATEYKKNGSIILYKWIQKEKKNRIYIVNKTFELLQEKEMINKEVDIESIKKLVNYKYAKAGNYIVTCEFLRNGPTVTGIAWPKYYLWISIFNSNTYDLAADGAIRLALLGYEEATRKVDITDYVCFNNEKQNKEDFTRVFPQAVCEKIFYRNNIK